MDQQHKRLLQSNHVYLVNHLDFRDALFHATLIQKCIITEDDLQRIQHKATTKEMASEFLLQILPRRGPQAFRKFMEALVECDMEFVATTLDPNMTIEIKNAMQ